MAVHGWQTSRHAAHPTTDFSVVDAPALWSELSAVVERTVFPTLFELFFPTSSDATALTLNDLFFVRYDATTAEGQRALEPHRDGSILSFNIALSSPEDFVGGGTRFVGADVVVSARRAGDLIAHSGKVLHAGDPITAGVRCILVGFVSASGPDVNDAFLASSMVTAAVEHQRLDLAIVNGALVSTAR